MIHEEPKEHKGWNRKGYEGREGKLAIGYRLLAIGDWLNFYAMFR